MYLRLAFAVAAHLETEILLVDEILAVGDAQFQKKCMGKMQSISSEKRTIFFVSHNMSAVNRLCNRVLWIDRGSIRLDGKPEDVINQYLSSQAYMQDCQSAVTISEDTSNSVIKMESIRIISYKNQLSHIVEFNRSFRVEIRYQILERIRSVSILNRITDLRGNVICTSWDTDSTQWRERVRNPGHYTSICIIPPYLLRPGRYFLSVGALNETKRFAYHENVISFEMSAANYTLNIERVGIITPLFEWEVEQNG
jgi:lipopolysaccharide transport system ATP-binding protein